MRFATTDKNTGKVIIEEKDAPNGAATVLATAINPIDLILAGGAFPLRSYSPGQALGFGGIAEDSDGKRYYFYDVTQPEGSLNEQVSLSEARTIALPDGIDPKLAAALGVPGLAAYSAVTFSGKVQEGESVLITGASGSVGIVAGQVALSAGAKVYGLVRSEDKAKLVEDAGMIAIVEPEDLDDLSATVKEKAPEGIDLVVDNLWGSYPEALFGAMNHRARLVQVGSSAGASAALTAAVFRNKLISIIGHTNFLLTDEEAAEAYYNVAEFAAQGKVSMPFETVDLDGLPEVWEGLVSKKLSGKYVVTF
nr:zinc-binding dehydrogenase [Corynebacterium lactis]